MHVLIFLMVALVASYFQGITGFGQGLIAAPLALVLFGKYEALSIMLIAGLFLNSYLLITINEKLDRSLLKILVIGASSGLLLGLVAVRYTPLKVEQIIAGTMSIIAATLLVFSHFKIAKDKTNSLLVGSLSGFLQTSIGLSGPPVVLLLNAQNTPKQIMRKLLPAFFLFLGLAGSLLYGAAGFLRLKGLEIGLLSGPCVLIGGYIGNKQSHMFSQNTYRLITLIAVVLTGLLAISQGLIS